MKNSKRFLATILIFSFILPLLLPMHSQAASVKLNAKSKTIYVGKTFQLKLSGVKKGTSIKWKSSNKKVAKVSSTGKVTGVSVGKAKVSAIVSGKIYSCNINVSSRLSAKQTTFICKDNKEHTTITAKNLKDTEFIHIKIEDPSILSCVMEYTEDSKFLLKFFPMSDGETTVTLSISGSPKENISLKVICAAGDTLSNVDPYHYLAAYGYNLLFEYYYHPETLLIYDAWAAIDNESSMPYVVLYTSAQNDCGETLFGYDIFYLQNKEEAEAISPEYKYLLARPYDSTDDFFKTHCYVNYYNSEEFPSDLQKVKDLDASFVIALGDYYHYSNAYSILQNQ